MAKTVASVLALLLAWLPQKTNANLPRYGTCYGFVCVSTYMPVSEWRDRLYYQRSNGDRLLKVRLNGGDSFQILLRDKPAGCPADAGKVLLTKQEPRHVKAQGCISIVVAGRDQAFDAYFDFYATKSGDVRFQLRRIGPMLKLDHQYSAEGPPLPPRRADDPPVASPPLYFGDR